MRLLVPATNHLCVSHHIFFSICRINIVCRIEKKKTVHFCYSQFSIVRHSNKMECNPIEIWHGFVPLQHFRSHKIRVHSIITAQLGLRSVNKIIKLWKCIEYFEYGIYMKNFTFLPMRTCTGYQFE